MGRGRAKAKQTKVARELKYNSPSMDVDALQEELSTSDGLGREDDDQVDSRYAEYSYDDRR